MKDKKPIQVASAGTRYVIDIDLNMSKEIGAVLCKQMAKELEDCTNEFYRRMVLDDNRKELECRLNEIFMGYHTKAIEMGNNDFHIADGCGKEW